MKHLRTADPYRDLDVIDAHAPRFNQAVIGALALVAFLTGWWPLLAYFELVQPRLGEGPIEDSRPPRFANKVGVVFLGAASVALALGFTVLGWTLALIDAALALGAAATGVCAGCEIYRLLARIGAVEFCATCLGREESGSVAVRRAEPGSG
jgi:hypothetical protein